MDISDSDSDSSNPSPPFGRSRISSGKKFLFHRDHVKDQFAYSSEEERDKIASPSTIYEPAAMDANQEVQLVDPQPSCKLELPRLNLRDLNQMYFNYDGRIYCRACW